MEQTVLQAVKLQSGQHGFAAVTACCAVKAWQQADMDGHWLPVVRLLVLNQYVVNVVLASKSLQEFCQS